MANDAKDTKAKDAPKSDSKPVEPTPADPKADAERKAFRREAALQILSAYVMRHGGFSQADMTANMQRVWEYAGCFVDLEDAKPLPPPKEFDVADLLVRPAPARPAAHPTDEWAVWDGDRKITGFVNRDEADMYMVAHPGSKVVQIAGPATLAGRVADPNVNA